MNAMTPRMLTMAVLALVTMPLMAQAGDTAAPAAAAARADLEPACAITGRVADVVAVATSPWANGTPSTLSVSETHVTVTLTQRHPRGKQTPDEPCALPAKGIAVYKLCAPAPLKKGDTITAVEGLATGKHGYRCLFDVAPVTVAPTSPAVPPAAQ